MKKLFAIIAAAALCLVIAGCAGQGSLGDEIIDDTGAIKVTADDAGKGSAIGSLGGGVVVEEGQVVLIAPDFEKGSLTIRLLDDNGDVIAEQVAEGTEPTSLEVAPGDYSIGIACEENGTTGTLVISAVDEAEAGQL